MTILVPKGPKIIKPVQGDSALMQEFILGLVGKEGIHWLLYWMKIAMERLNYWEPWGPPRSDGFNNPPRWRPILFLILCGPADAGKSLMQYFVTLMTGGRQADPWQAMIGETSFNMDLFGAEHHVISDRTLNPRKFNAGDFATNIKNFYFMTPQRCHPKGGTPFLVSPIWTPSMSCNDDEASISVIPRLSENLKDKILALKCYANPVLKACNTMESRQDLIDVLKSQIPAFLWFLKHEVSIPDVFRDGRTGLKSFQSPELILDMEQAAGDMDLLEAVVGAIKRHESPSGIPAEAWSGSATRLYEICENSLRPHGVHSVVGLGRRLVSISAFHPDLVSIKKEHHVSIYSVTLKSP